MNSFLNSKLETQNKNNNHGNFNIFFGIPILLIALFFILLPLIAVVDILRSEFKGNDGIMLALLVIFVPFGAIAYFFLAPARKIYRRH